MKSVSKDTCTCLYELRGEKHCLTVTQISQHVCNFACELCCEKTCLCCFRPGQTQTRLYNYRRLPELWNFGFRKERDCTMYVAKNKGADKQKSGFLMIELIYKVINKKV